MWRDFFGYNKCFKSHSLLLEEQVEVLPSHSSPACTHFKKVNKLVQNKDAIFIRATMPVLQLIWWHGGSSRKGKETMFSVCMKSSRSVLLWHELYVHVSYAFSIYMHKNETFDWIAVGSGLFLLITVHNWIE